MEIKRCPFCGCEADWGMDDDGFFFVGCIDDFSCFGSIDKAGARFRTEIEAIEAWNRRVENGT